MSFIKSYDDINLDNNEEFDELLEIQGKICETIEMIESTLSSCEELRDKAFEQKDPLLYIYATGLLFLIKNIDALPSDIDDYNELSRLILDGTVSGSKAVDIDSLTKMGDLCRRAKKVDLFDIPGRENHPIILNGKNFSIRDLIGLAIKIIQNQKEIEEALFSK